MGQQEVINVLKKACEELTTPEICEQLEVSLLAVQNALKRLLKDPFVTIKYRELTFDEKKKRFGKVVNPRIMVYWIE